MTDKTYRERVYGLRSHCMNLRQGIGFHDCRELAAKIASEADAELAACRLRIAELITRLEIDDRAPGFDGIACRDATILELEREIEDLRAGVVRAAIDLVSAVDERHDTNELPIKYTVPWGAVAELKSALGYVGAVLNSKKESST